MLPMRCPLLVVLGGSRRRDRGRRCGLAPFLEVREALDGLQRVLLGLLQLVVNDAFVVRGLPLRVRVASRRVEESMVWLGKREKELADSVL